MDQPTKMASSLSIWDMQAKPHVRNGIGGLGLFSLKDGLHKNFLLKAVEQGSSWKLSGGSMKMLVLSGNLGIADKCHISIVSKLSKSAVMNID
jgi:hypothetical protein